jgi:geranylgeranyl diphosphate synthase type I
VSGEIDADQLDFMRSTIVESGALARTERMIEEYSSQAVQALSVLDISDNAREKLAHLADAVINRAK